MTSITSNKVRDLNDAMRRQGPASGQWVMTAGAFAQGPEFYDLAIAAVKNFSTFDEDNDPYGEHDFGAFDLCGKRLFWKIDYYDKSLQAGSDDPADPNVTTRVLTIMLASEY